MKKQYIAPKSELILTAPIVLAATSAGNIPVSDSGSEKGKMYSRRWDYDDYEDE